jgi:putative copper export protein
MLYKTLLLLHLLGASIWVGGHLVLALRVLPRAWRSGRWSMVHEFEEHFESIGLPALFIQIVTGIWLALRYLPFTSWFSFQNYFSSHIVLKLVFLLLTVVLAIHARLFLIPQKDKPQAMHSLAFHIIGVTTLALLFVWIGVGFRTGGAW